VGQSAGPGEPVVFQCQKCRRGNTRYTVVDAGHTGRVTLTGRKRARYGGGIQVGRHGHIAREYKCNDCGHVGWSRHTDLERVERRQAGEDRDAPSS